MLLEAHSWSRGMLAPFKQRWVTVESMTNLGVEGQRGNMRESCEGGEHILPVLQGGGYEWNKKCELFLEW